MNLDEMQSAVNEAKATISLADRLVGKMAGLIVGRLRKSDVWYAHLTALKKELRDWDMHRGCWIDRG